MDINLIKRLIKIVEQSQITDLSVQEGELRVRISKNSNSASQLKYQTVHELQPSSIQMPVQAVEPVRDTKTAGEEVHADNIHEIRSPIVGTFYRAPAPDADPYVQVGDVISPGMVLCIVEAMKLMNEIESDVSGKIVKILVENATPVEYNQPLFLVEKT